jgi:hypothetical protein
LRDEERSLASVEQEVSRLKTAMTRASDPAHFIVDVMRRPRPGQKK